MPDVTAKICCAQMRVALNDGYVFYEDRFDQYNLIVSDVDGARVLQKIEFCPWSGTLLPPSQRERWFDELEAMGLDPTTDPIPDKYKTAEWRR